MSIETAVRAMLTSYSLSVPDARVTHGYRLQETVLPAITFEVQSIDNESVSGSKSAMVELRAIADTTSEALDLASELANAARIGTFDGTTFTAVIWMNAHVEPSTPGDGDESEPAEVVATAQIYY